jgi:coenzyme F420-reducing hydrogenase delta subunit
MYWCSSAESEKLVKSIEDAYAKISNLGPNPISTLENKQEVITAPIE